MPRQLHVKRKFFCFGSLPRPLPRQVAQGAVLARGNSFQLRPLVTKSVITSSRNIIIVIRKVHRKLDFRGFQSIGGRTHNSIGSERYGVCNIEVLHWPKIIFSLFLPICSFSPSFNSVSSKIRFNTTRMEWTYTCSTNTLNNLIYSGTKHK